MRGNAQHIMKPRQLLQFSAVISAVSALILLMLPWNFTSYLHVPVSAQLYVLGMALMQVIFTIWFFKGAGEFEFARLGALTRIFIGLCFAVWAVHLRSTVLDAEMHSWLARGMIVYAAIEVLVGSFLLTATTHSRIGETKERAMTAIHYNRLLFAIYMILLSGWIFFLPDSFIAFFHLPLPASATEANLLHGLLAVFSLLLLQLALFNLIAVRYRIEVLITAGMRGGLVACVAASLLVLFRIAHPLVLLIPAVDLVSVAAIALGKIGRR